MKNNLRAPNHLRQKPQETWTDQDWADYDNFRKEESRRASRLNNQRSGQWAYDQVESLVPRRVVKEAILFWERSVRARWIDHFLLVVKARQNGEPEPEPEEPH
jgi:hypothetical protein